MSRLPPGEYVPDVTEGITRVEDLPKPKMERRSFNFKRRRCPCCGYMAYRDKVGSRTLHDLGDARNGRPIDIHVVYSQHHCSQCGSYFSAIMDALAPPKGHYTHRVMERAVASVIEDGLPYLAASWRLWRDHRVFVPWATIQNWVEAAGKKRRRPRRR